MIPNPWDGGTAIVLETLGFKALATTSGGMAFALGRPDDGVAALVGRHSAPTAAVTLDDVVDHVRIVTAATELPVSVDLRTDTGLRQRTLPPRSPGSPRRARSVALSRTTTRRRRRSTRPGTRRSGSRPRARRPRPSASRSFSPPALRTSSTTTPTSTTRSRACRPTRRRGPTSSTRRRCERPTRSTRSPTSPASRSMSSRGRSCR